MTNKTRPLHVLFVFAPGIMAGAEKVVIAGMTALLKEDLHLELILIKEMRVPQFALNFKKSLPENLLVHELKSRWPIDLRLIKNALNLIRRKKNKVILHSHGIKALFVISMIRIFTSNIIHIHTHHGNTSHNFKMKIYEWISHFLMKKCHHIIAVGPHMEHQLKNELFPYSKISAIENMLSMPNQYSCYEQKGIFLASKKETMTKIHLLFLGRLSEEKGILHFLDFFDQYPQKNDFHLTIVGDGPQRKIIEDTIVIRQMESLVTIVGHVNHPESYFIENDLLILPSYREGLPLTLIEALSIGMPVMANDVGSIQFLIKNNQNGLLIESMEINLWHEALDTALKSIKHWQKFSLLNANEIANRFSPKSWAFKTRILYLNELAKDELKSDPP